MFRTRSAQPIWASGPRPHTQAGHMTAIDQTRPVNCTKSLQPGGRPHMGSGLGASHRPGMTALCVPLYPDRRGAPNAVIDAAIVGLGRWGQKLVASVQGKSERLRFTAAVSRDPARVGEFAARHRLRILGSLDEALVDPGIDAVVLATPHSHHADEIVAAAAGKAVFCEKPLTLTRVEALRVTAACRKAGVVLGVGTDKRFFPAMAELARIVAGGELGRILHIEANFSNEVAARMFSPWRDSPEESPAGGMTGTGIHMLDAMIGMAGPVRRVQAQLLALKPAPDPLDTISVLLEFRSGISGILAAVRSTPA